ncbi:MAG: efflux RND transporter periplasmic adaptor subunit, partial [Armatimonadota bacterium]|nr:efflux RND transporter periplasmic adaptor subunit [Armatimonadota bacterium]
MTGVRVERIGRQPLAESIEPVGTVRARKQTVLSSRIVATVVAVHVVEGQRVRADDVVVTLDDRDVRAQLERARAGLREAQSAPEEVERSLRAAERAVEAARAQRDLAERTLVRYQALLDRRSVAPQEYDEVAARARAAAAEVERLEEMRASLLARRAQVLARIEQAEAEVRAATVTLGYTTLRAPLDGVVVAKPVEVGNLAAPGVPLVTLEEERYRLEVVVEESQIQKIRLGQRATVVIDALRAEVAGTVAEVVPAADPASRTFVVKVELPPRAGLRSGLFGRARFAVGERSVLAVPRAALVQRGQLQSVYVVEPDGVARLRLVKSGRALGER